MKLKKYFKDLYHYFQESERVFLFFFSVFLGCGVGLGAVFFRWLINLFTILFFEKGHILLSFMGQYYVIVVPVIGGLIVGPMIYFLAREAKGHGVPEVMLAVAREGGKIRPVVAIVKSLASSICIGSGGSVGREGPIVQIGSGLGSSLGQLFRLSKHKTKILVACGAAGGISATFNAPLAGIFFAQEVILRRYGFRFLSAVVLSAVSANVVACHFIGDNSAFMVPTYRLLSLWEFPLYVILGFLSGFTAYLFIKILYTSEDIVDKIAIPEYWKPAIGGLLLGLIGLYYPQIFGVGYDTIEKALVGNLAVSLVIALVFIKLLATSLTLAFGGSGGVFAPSLFIGAMLGEAYGIITHFLLPSIAIPGGAGALVGMAAVFSGAAQAPVSAILILFEMTGNYKIMLPLMITCIISTLVVRYLSKDSIYTLKLRRRGINIDEIRHIDLLEVIKVSEAMRKDVYTVNETDKIKDAALMIKSKGHRGFPVLDKDNNLVGIVTYQSINKALEGNNSDRPVKDIMEKDLIVCFPHENLRTVMDKLGHKNIGRLPVVERDNRKKLLGLVTRKTIITAYNMALHGEEGEETLNE